MKDFIQFCRELGPIVVMCCATGFGIGGLVGYAAGAGAAQSIDRQIQRYERIEQQCIDGNNNACRVMELRP
ncbi:hypothetical protein L2249_19940 [Xanthomonas perforans]|uniref:hypothetical protein n=1 Tax=Xanthomonas perforans TaxID=442694 RepID=UPI00062D24A2|nr:hypothetical protein [Xanthomonas perforans]KLC07944.1 hypothetical protein XP420_07725 [Xanthomonas perforans]KLC60429.1 hypothetical protein GEV872_14425 [Xanthomonas perforans]KLC71605.1 hypothetical protein GEV893_01205 [Xanthomonas perforans]KLC75555.1 hypothetical protein GEV904_12305 [Xanthomonas perforans]KLC77338.1 hypothetical protein GEV909_05865 [Xanthomonas perforans]